MVFYCRIWQVLLHYQEPFKIIYIDVNIFVYIFDTNFFKNKSAEGETWTPEGQSPTSFPGLRLRPLDYLGIQLFEKAGKKSLWNDGSEPSQSTQYIFEV